MDTRTSTKPEQTRSQGNGVSGSHAGLPRLMDVATLAAHLGLTVRTIRRKVAQGEIPFLKLGHLIRFDAVEINAWLDQARVAPHAGHTVAGRNGARP